MSKKGGLREQVWTADFHCAFSLLQVVNAARQGCTSHQQLCNAELEDSRPKQTHPIDTRCHQSTSYDQHWCAHTPCHDLGNADYASTCWLCADQPVILCWVLAGLSCETRQLVLTGTIGHVAHGKSTVVKAISGVQTVRFKNELERNITIKLGYANAKIYCAKDGKVPRPQSYKAYGSSKEDSPPCDAPGYEGAEMELLRHVSFVDCPGHDILMATMLNGAAVMDGALLLIAANESCPQPQTSEHLAAVEIMRLKHIIILQNKIDLISESVAANQHEAIQTFIQGTIAEGAPVVPISAQLKYNVDAVCEYIVKKIPVPVRCASAIKRISCMLVECTLISCG